MIAYNKTATWASSVQPFPFPPPFPRHLACALEGTISTGNTWLFILCYSPQEHATHAEACSALNNKLPLQQMDHHVILGGDFQDEWTSPSDKSCHLRILAFSKFLGLPLPTYTPTHHPEKNNMHRSSYNTRLLRHNHPNKRHEDNRSLVS